MTSNRPLQVDMELDGAGRERDTTKWVWLGVIGLFVAMGAILYVYSGLNPQVSVVRIRHILVTFDKKDPASRAQALERIRGIRERVVKGEDFGKLARDNSNDAMTAAKDGDLGYVTRGQLDAAIETYAWSAPIGQLSDVITSSFGFHIVVVDDRRLSKADQLAERQPAAGNTAPAAKP